MRHTVAPPGPPAKSVYKEGRIKRQREIGRADPSAVCPLPVEGKVAEVTAFFENLR